MSSVDGLRADIVWEANTGQVIAELGAVGDEYNRTTGSMSTQALKLAAAQDRLTASIKRSGPESRAAKTATLAYREELAAVAKQADATSSAISRQAATQAKAAQVASDAALKNQLAAARTVGHTLTSYITVPTALIGAAAVKMGIDFQQQMLLIRTEAGASAAEVHNLSDEVLALAKTVPGGPTKLAQALFPIESVGLRGANALNALKVAAVGASVGQADMVDTANVLAAALVTGIKGTQNYSHAMASLIAITGAGKMTLQELDDAFGTGLLVKAKNAGLDLRQVGAALDVLVDRGLPARRAATQLGTTLALIQAPSAAAQKALADLGINQDELARTLRQPDGLLKVLQLLHGAMERLGNVQGSKDILSAFGRSKQSGAILTLVQSLDSGISSYTSKLAQYDQNVSKAIKSTAVEQQSANYKLRTDLSGLESDLTKFGQDIAPDVVKVADAFVKILDVVSRLNPVAKAELGGLVALLAIGGPLIVGIAGVVRAVQTIGKAFRRIPADAGPAIAETDAELATLRGSAAKTAASIEADGAEAGAGLATGVGAGARTAETKVGLLRKSLLGLGALTIAPIVIPIEYHLIGSLWSKIFGDSAFGGLSDAIPKPGSENPYPQGTSDYFEWEAGHRGLGRGRHKIKGVGDLYVDPSNKAYKQGARSRTRAGGSGGGGGGGGGGRAGGAGGGGAFTTTIPIDLQIKLARDQYRGDEAAEKQDLEQEKAHLERELKLAKTKKDRLAALQALQAVQDQIDSLTGKATSSAASTRSAAARKRSAADQQEEAKLDSRITGAQSAEKTATTAKQERAAYERERDARKLLLALYEREAHVATLTRSQRATAERKAAAERKQLALLDDKSRQDELDFAVLQAKNAVAAATVGSKAYDRAVAAEKRALEAQIAYDKKRADNAKLSLASRKKALQEELAARKQLASLEKQSSASSASAQKEQAQFLSEAARILFNYAPNATPTGGLAGGGKTDTRLYEAVHELRQQTHHLAQMRKSGRFPSSHESEEASLAAIG